MNLSSRNNFLLQPASFQGVVASCLLRLMLNITSWNSFSNLAVDVATQSVCHQQSSRIHHTIQPSLEVELFQCLGPPMHKFCKWKSHPKVKKTTPIPSDYVLYRFVKINIYIESSCCIYNAILPKISLKKTSAPMTRWQRPKIRARDPGFFSSTAGRWSLFHFRCKDARLHWYQLLISWALRSWDV